MFDADRNVVTLKTSGASDALVGKKRQPNIMFLGWVLHGFATHSLHFFYKQCIFCNWPFPFFLGQRVLTWRRGEQDQGHAAGGSSMGGEDECS